MSILSNLFSNGNRNLSKEYFERIIKGSVDNPKFNLVHDYKEGKQWKANGQITGTGISIIDRTSPDKAYHGVVMNLVEDAISSMVSFTMGEEEEEYTALSTDNPKTNEMLKEINVNDLVEDILETSLSYKKAVIGLFASPLGTPYAEVYSPREMYVDGNNYHLVTKVPGTTDKYSITIYSFGFTDPVTGITDYNKVGIQFYENMKYLGQANDPLGVLPFYTIDLDTEFITPSLLKIQDYINIKHTKVFDIEKYNSDPLTVLKTVKPIGVTQKPRVGSGSLVNLGVEDSLERIAGTSIDPEFRKSIEDMKLDFWKKAHLGALKNSDLSGVTSGYAIQLKLIDTFAYANNLRTRLKGEMLGFFKFFFNQMQDERFFVQQVFLSPLQGERLKEVEQKGIKIDNIKKEAELLNILVQGGMTREEAQTYIDLKLL